MRARGTKLRIIDTAIELFNQRGTQAVSTNHIAEAMGISPGNLYYHFRNKEEIIRAILERMIALMDGSWSPQQKPSLAHLREVLNKDFFLLWEYRFFHRELIILLEKDPVLKQRYHAIRQQRLPEIESFLQGLIGTGVMRSPESLTTLASLTKIVWLISDYWLAFLDVEGKSLSPQNVQEAIELIVEVLRPYLNEAALVELRTSTNLATQDEKKNVSQTHVS